MSLEFTEQEKKQVDDFFWCMIEQARWKRWKSLLDSLGNIIGEGALDMFKASIADYYLTNYSKEDLHRMIVFCEDKVLRLYRRKDNFDTYDIQDAAFMDMCWEVVARGKNFYNSITHNKLKTMYQNKDYLQDGFEFISMYGNKDNLYL